MTGNRSATPANPAAVTTTAAQGCLHHTFEQQAKQRPDAIAISYGNNRLSYAELDQQANQLANLLVAAGVNPDTTVGLCLDRSIELVVGLLGILKAGGAYVPLDPSYPPDRLAHILDQAAPQIIVTRHSLHNALPASSASFIDIETIDNAKTTCPNVAVRPDHLCYLIFTSGSTGLPKGVMVTHHNVARLFSTISQQISFSENDIWTLFHSYAFGYSAWELFGSLLHGAQLVIVPDEIRGDPAGLYALLRDEKVTVFSQTPSAFRQLLLHDAFNNSNDELSLRSIVFSGEAVVTRDLETWFKKHGDAGPRLINTYAITETGGQVAFRQYDGSNIDDSKARNIGLPLTDTQVYILDEDLQPVTTGKAGELCVGGPGLSRGYINQPDLTAEKFITINIPGESTARIYRTGDQARQLDNSEIEFIGRTDNQVKIRGYRIELGDIEACLGSHPEVNETAITLRHDDSGEPRLVAYVVSNNLTKPPTVSNLRSYIEKSLPEYMVPAIYVFLDALPLNPNGKLDRRALPAPNNARPELITPYVAPTGKLQDKLAVIWAETLGLDKVGINDNFFELGGDSILALKLTNQLRQLLGDYIYISALIDAPSIAQLAKYLQRDHADAIANIGTQTVSAEEQLPTVVPNHAGQFETFELTDIQQAYLVGRGTDFSMGNVSTHLYIEVDTKDLDLPRLERAWQRVIDRHPMLRAVVLPDGVQKILPDVPPYRFPVQDLSQLDDTAVKAGLLQERDRLSHQLIPSDRWPLFELSASVMPANTTRVHISLDCLITDARSFQIMSAELLTFYHDEQAELPLPGVSFRDYVITEHQLRDGSFYQRALDYWKQRIQTLPPMPQLPLACAPETLEEHIFSQRGMELGKDEWEHFQARASKAGITPTAALLQCFGETLAAWSRAPRLTLNLTLFNRMPLHPDVDNVVGDFTSLVLLGIDKLNQGGFESRAQRLQKELWQGVDNRFVSGVRVMREMAQMGDKVQPMMPVVFTSTLGIGSGGQDSSSWHQLGEQVFSVSQTPQVWIDHVASEREGALWYTWDVVDQLFPKGMIDDMFAAYGKRLKQLATDDAAWEQDWITSLINLLPEQQRQLRDEINATEAPEPGELLHAGFTRSAAATPTATAIIANDRSLTYAELDQLSNQLAHQLHAQGVQTNELVAVVMQKGWEQVVAVLGILKAGAAYLPIDASMPAERLHYLLDFGQARLAVTQVCQDAAIDWPTDTIRLRISDDELSAAPDTELSNQTTLSDIAYVIFTSGSTGQPKGVVIDHRGAVNTCADVNQRFKVTAKDRVLALSSLSFDLSVYDIFGVLAAGGAIVMPDASGMRDPAHWASMVAKHQISVWNTVPALMDLLTDYAEQQTAPVLQSLRIVMMSGDWIPVKLPKRIQAVGQDIQVYSLGGATEASIWSILYPIENVPPDWISIPYGKPMLNQSFHVFNSDLTPCPVWVPGELYIGGIGVAKGYWRDDEKTAASFITHPNTGERLYRTGDLGRYLPDGNIEFMGREDFQVKIQGFRVELGDIEAALEAHPGIRNTVVIASGPDHGNKRLIAYLVAEHDPAPGTEELRAWLGNKLPEYMVPSSFITLNKLPLTANGKVDRRELPEPPSLESETTSQASTTDTALPDTDIARLVSEILGGAEIAPDTNLLQMGATSIEMIRIANALDQHLGFRPRMDDFYRDPSITGLTTLYSQHQPQVKASTADTSGDPLRTPDWLLAGIEKVMDPDERNTFKASRPALKRFTADTKDITLPGGVVSEDRYIEHRSHRNFTEQPLATESLSNLLGCLASIQLNDNPKYLYASAGGLYPIQTYIYIKPNRINGIDAGIYYHDPDQHRLVQVNTNSEAIRSIYDPLINRPIFDNAAFAIFLVAELKSIGAMYQERALHYSTLEAGHITQLLEMRAADFGIGLCQIGGLETPDLVELLELDTSQLVLHGLLGGGMTENTTAAAEKHSPDERDEGEL
ncbi:MAG: amino acid adenylation domain-containing protein [Gammaproteobacteria bacterium]|nr:amino acid adenylation domain-containing protein [Gammaproteobacteria bacterium]MCP4089806.1 amino acid adenylation domain-containing protein [Gammaproteobacteria bacterium]MCP4278177.1 amino acid adenylation domain-containing protein [Gammaproteobacteria bacterium]MCP4927632.1 amino acid adenylation domain-containing protein [Gammaproteobacteria bacterium]